MVVVVVRLVVLALVPVFVARIYLIPSGPMETARARRYRGVHAPRDVKQCGVE
jgi:hypothetical protein